jgi:transmembrane sensor
MHLNEDPLRISLLIQKKIKNSLSVAEEQELGQWLDEKPEHAALYARCLDNVVQQEAYRYLTNVDTKGAWKDILPAIETKIETIRKPVFKRNLIRYVAAACILLVGVLVALPYLTKDNLPKETELTTVDYSPAQNKAILKLSDGTTLTLDSKHEEVAIAGNSIKYSDGKELINTDDISSAVISTPRGGYYRVVLPDGTKVQLNAGSSLTYPLTFTGNTREVFARGELYFEVTPDKTKPFVVHTEQQVLQVLGTKFNVNSYAQVKTVKTSLIEGKVQISSPTLKPVLLTPGQQSIVKSNHIQVKNIDPEQVTAWIHGKFNFDGKHLREVMQELSLWYDIDIAIDADVPEVEFFGGIYRGNNLSTILSLLEQNEIAYKLTNDKKLLITKVKPK